MSRQPSRCETSLAPASGTLNWSANFFVCSSSASKWRKKSCQFPICIPSENGNQHFQALQLNRELTLTYSLVIPAYNESTRIRPTLDEILRYIKEHRWDAEILIVDDGSRDDTARIVLEYGSVHPQV